MNSILFRRITTQLNANYFRLNTQNHNLISCKTLRKLYSFSNGLNESQSVLKETNGSTEWQTNRSISTSHEFNLLINRLNDTFVQQKRYKKGKKGSKRDTKEESSDEESDAEEEQLDELDTDLIDGKAIGFKDVDITVVSLRLDTVLKSGINMIRNRVEEAIYDNRVRLNGERVSKKSTELAEMDEIDYIKGLNHDNQDLVDISRVVLKKIEDKYTSKDRIRAKLRVFKELTIENYPNNPYDGYAINIPKKEKEIDN